MVARVRSASLEPLSVGSSFVPDRVPPATSPGRVTMVALTACVVLEDGTVFPGERIGAPTDAAGEVVFTTSMTGYQEVMSDPSYRGQIVVMAYPLVGNYGFSPQAWEARRPHVAGFVVREACPIPSNYQSDEPLTDFLRRYGLVGLSGVDTRRLVRHLRVHGLQRGVIGDGAVSSLIERARAVPFLDEQDLVGQVACTAPHMLGGEGPRVVIIDCGVKAGIIDALRRRGCEIILVPPRFTASEITRLAPAGIVLSNGPGDPAVLGETVRLVKDLLGTCPIMGICLGHQILALALGGRTYKMKFGHRGSNHPVHEPSTGQVVITTQNHGYAVDPALPDSVLVTHVSLNDGTVEGLRHRTLPAFSVQFHPEGRPGPADAEYLYDRFVSTLAPCGTPSSSGAPVSTQAGVG